MAAAGSWVVASHGGSAADTREACVVCIPEATEDERSMHEAARQEGKGSERRKQTAMEKKEKKSAKKKNVQYQGFARGHPPYY